jgi:hypothetical protein
VAQISLPVFLYGFITLIFGLPFLYFAWRTGQRWKRGENLLTGGTYPRVLGLSLVFGFHAISRGQWASGIVALLMLIGSSWMYLVERNDSRV